MSAAGSALVPFALGRFGSGSDATFLGIVQDDLVVPAGSLGVAGLSDDRSIRSLLERVDDVLEAVASSLASGRAGRRLPLADLRPHAPIPDARQLFCAGANYGRHVVEMATVMPHPDTKGMEIEQRRDYGRALVERQRADGKPYIFMKPTSAIAGPWDDLVLPAFSQRIDWEIELAAVVGKAAYRVQRAEAMANIAGYMVANDVTARDKVQRSDPGAFGPDWVGAKGAPGFLPTGPLFVPARFVRDPHDLAMRLWVNGEAMQDDRTNDMTFSIDRQIEHLAEHTRLLPGDILCTGSPAGNGIARGVFLRPGDLIEAEIEGLGRQRTQCVGAETIGA